MGRCGGQGIPRIDAIRQVQITEQTFYRWRKQYGGMGTDQLKELKRLQKENDRLQTKRRKSPMTHGVRHSKTKQITGQNLRPLKTCENMVSIQKTTGCPPQRNPEHSESEKL